MNTYNNKEMKKLLFTMVLFAMSTAIGRAQNEAGTWTLTPKVGMNIARLTNPDIYIDMSNDKIEYGNKMALVAGLEAEYHFDERIGLSAELLYSNQGYHMKDNAAFRNGKATIHYLNVPLTGKFYLPNGLAFRVGLQPGYALGRHIEVDAEDGTGHWTHTSTDDTWFRRFDLSIPFGLSYSIGAIELDARYNFGVTNASNVDAIKIHNRVLQLTVGYRFSLK